MITLGEILFHFEDDFFPATREDLIEYAESAEASPALVAALYGLEPEGSYKYRNLADLASVI